MITSAGKSSAVEDQFNFSMPLSIKIATYMRAPAVAYGGIIEARGDKNKRRHIESRKNNPDSRKKKSKWAHKKGGDGKRKFSGGNKFGGGGGKGKN